MYVNTLEWDAVYIFFNRLNILHDLTTSPRYKTGKVTAFLPSMLARFLLIGLIPAPRNI